MSEFERLEAEIPKCHLEKAQKSSKKLKKAQKRAKKREQKTKNAPMKIGEYLRVFESI